MIKSRARSVSTSVVNFSDFLNFPSQESTFPENVFLEAKVEQKIPQGESGRVSFRGTSWKARMDNQTSAEAGQKVLVIGRQSSTTLLVTAL